MSGVRCFNPACGDDGRCALDKCGMCPVAEEEMAYWRGQYALDAKFRPMTQEQQVEHFAWKHGNGPDPYDPEEC
jgi:hypothetical protein